jgi:hypothetical protein
LVWKFTSARNFAQNKSARAKMHNHKTMADKLPGALGGSFIGNISAFFMLLTNENKEKVC